MLSFIKNIFSVCEPQKKTPDKIKANPKYNIVSFYIDEWNRYHMSMNFDIDNSSSIEEFGKLLYLINSGKYEQNILDYMIELSNRKPLLKKSIQETMISWAMSVKSNLDTKDSVPYIRPTQVFK